MAVHPWRLLSLCAGVGGLDLGVRLAEPEARSVCYVEREAAAAAIMVARMEDGWLHPAPIWSDLATFDAGTWRGAVDCVVSGDPCQPNSVAGRGLGADDDRWLLDRVIDVVRACRPDRVFRENVPGNADGQLGVIIPALEGLGYRVAAGLFSAKELGFAHGRERLFVMANRDGEPRRVHEAGWHDQAQAAHGRATLVDACRPTRGRARGTGQTTPGSQPAKCDEPGRSGRGLADADVARLPIRTLPAIGQGVVGQEGQAAGTSGDHPLLCLGPSDPRWPDIIARAPHLEPAVRRMAHGMADRVDRLRACGNGVVPLVAGYAWRTLEARLAEGAETGDLAVRAA